MNFTKGHKKIKYKNDAQHERKLILKSHQNLCTDNFDGYLNASKTALKRSYSKFNHIHKKTAHKV